MQTPEGGRPLRSYVLRQGRMTAAQQRGFDEGMQRFGLHQEAGLLDVDSVFGRSGAPMTLEIGFGMGDSLLAMAQAEPQRNFIGIEVHRPGVGRLLHSVIAADVSNVRVYCHDAVAILQDCIPASTLDTVQIFFPDPWHKKRHHKRRLVQPAFVALLRSRLRPGGRLHLATDWEHYAEQMLAVLEEAPGLVNTHNGFTPRDATLRPATKFEQRGERLGHAVFDLVYRRAD